MAQIKKAIIAIIGSFLGAFLWYLIIALAFKNANIGWLFFVLFIAFTYLLYTRTSRARHTAGWSAVILSLGSFGIPISTLLFSATTAAEYAKQGAGEAIGAGIGGAIVTGVGTILGLFFGIIFAIIAWVLLRKGKE